MKRLDQKIFYDIIERKLDVDDKICKTWQFANEPEGINFKFLAVKICKTN